MLIKYCNYDGLCSGPHPQLLSVRLSAYPHPSLIHSLIPGELRPRISVIVFLSPTAPFRLFALNWDEKSKCLSSFLFEETFQFRATRSTLFLLKKTVFVKVFELFFRYSNRWNWFRVFRYLLVIIQSQTRIQSTLKMLNKSVRNAEKLFNYLLAQWRDTVSDGGSRKLWALDLIALDREVIAISRRSGLIDFSSAYSNSRMVSSAESYGFISLCHVPLTISNLNFRKIVRPL